MKDASHYKRELEELLLLVARENGSDLHLSPGTYPTIRVDGRLMALNQRAILDPETLEGFALAIMGTENKEKFLLEKEYDTSYSLDEKARFRINIYFTKRSFAVAARYIPFEIRTIEELRLPPIVKFFSRLSQGFVLIV